MNFKRQGDYSQSIAQSIRSGQKKDSMGTIFVMMVSISSLANRAADMLMVSGKNTSWTIERDMYLSQLSLAVPTISAIYSVYSEHIINHWYVYKTG
ncbi:MAG: hypothetical protein CR997_02895 [Acidobacteria bacterium]|nr:MAG: hypothetical protein CR997_02895 [Acidobacteriota bacterium]